MQLRIMMMTAVRDTRAYHVPLPRFRLLGGGALIIAIAALANDDDADYDDEDDDDADDTDDITDKCTFGHIVAYVHMLYYIMFHYACTFDIVYITLHGIADLCSCA